MILWIKALHVISVIAWMAGMLYLPRLFVYHAEAGAGSPQAETFKVMEKKLLRLIINPAMIAAWVFGLALIFMPGGVGIGAGPWLWAKLALVTLLSGFHGWLSAERRRLEQDEIRQNPRFYRMINEVPTVIMVFVVILVIVKPFAP
ncbi:protoporphyrinogen oxidase HemJ [bacterium AH-315-P15]|nr:protoporphyrinogen oxidase HemJ [bacterium AH-315-P15]